MNNKTLSLAARPHHLAQVEVQILFFTCEELLQPLLNNNAQALVRGKKSPLWNSHKSACNIHFMSTYTLSVKIQGAAVLLFSEGMALWL